MKSDKVIVFIHGLHENAGSWKSWKFYFKELGYTCFAPDYPFHEGIPSELRNNPRKELRFIRMKDVVEHFEKFLHNIGSEKVILIGHSMGGLIVQKLIESNMGALGICITSASPKGVFSFKWSFFKSNIGVVNPFKGNSIYCATKNWFHYAICNTLTREESDKIYEKAVVPEGRNIPRSSRFNDGVIDFTKPHKPLLFISAEKDHIIPISLNKKNVAAYTDKNSITEFQAFKNKSHSICVQSGWEEVAGFIEKWIIKRSAF